MTALMETLIDFSDPLLWRAVACIIAAPLIWNILARLEYKTHLLTFLACGNKYLGCYCLAIWIFCFSSYRDFMFHSVVESQPTLDLISAPVASFCFAVFAGFGSILVMSSFYQLGITGTFLGDYFGILMSAKVEAFPFSVVSDPMYLGATLIFTGTTI